MISYEPRPVRVAIKASNAESLNCNFLILAAIVAPPLSTPEQCSKESGSTILPQHGPDVDRIFTVLEWIGESLSVQSVSRSKADAVIVTGDERRRTAQN